MDEVRLELWTWAGRSCCPLSLCFFYSILWVADVTGIVRSFNVLSIYSLGVLIAGSMCLQRASPSVTYRQRLTHRQTLDVLIAHRNLISFGADLLWTADPPTTKQFIRTAGPRMIQNWTGTIIKSAIWGSELPTMNVYIKPEKLKRY